MYVPNLPSRCILGKAGHDWQDVDYILKLFASSRPEAIRRYREYVKKAKGQENGLILLEAVWSEAPVAGQR